MKLIIAEKPSVAQTIAAALGAKKKQDGYIEGNGYLISWCVGHLVQLADAAAYGEQYKKWSYDSLPILPQPWQYTVFKDRQKQFKILKNLMRRSDVSEVVNACDAGREGELIFRDLDAKVQATMLHLLVDRKDQYIGDSIWCSKKGGKDIKLTSDAPETNVTLGGDSDAGPMKYFDGFVVRCLDNLKANSVAAGTRTEAQKNEAATGKVILAGSTAITTGEAVEKALYAMYRQCPKKLRKNKKLKFVMGWELWDLYDAYLSSKDVKYTENADVNKYRFKGKEIKVIDGIPEQTIALGKFTRDMDSCLWMGVDYATDQESVKVEKLQANSELYFFQMRMKVDVNIVLPSEIVLWTTYKYTE